MRALVISGGGCKGAFAIGAIEYLLEQNKRWDIIIGTSTGALIAPMVAAKKFKQVKDIYSNIKTSDLIRRYCWCTIPWRSALYNDKGLRNVISEAYTQEIHRFLIHDFEAPHVAVCTVSLNSGYITYWSPRDCTREEFCRALSASSNQPGLMPPMQVKKGGERHVDGGVREIVPVSYAVEIGATEVTAVVLSSNTLEYNDDDFDRIPSVLLRTLDLMTTEIRECDLIENVKLTVIRPDDSLIDNSLRFNPKEMREMMKKGYEVAKRVLPPKSVVGSS